MYTRQHAKDKQSSSQYWKRREMVEKDLGLSSEKQVNVQILVEWPQVHLVNFTYSAESERK